MTETIDLDAIAVIYDGDYLSSVPNTYKAFLELLRDKAGLTDEEFCNKTVYKGDFPIACKKDYIKAIRSCKDEGIMQIDLVSNELDEKEGIGEKDYLHFLELKEAEEPIKINKEEEENKEETIYIQSNVNEFFAETKVIQYYKNNNNKPVELTVIYPLRKEINFKKLSLDINGKKSYSRIFEKEKAEDKLSDAIASGNVGIISKYTEDDPNSYSITIANVAPDTMIELTSEFIQFITSDDMSLCYSVMTNYPIFNDSISRNYLKNINGKISLKTHSKITRLVNQNFTIDKYFKREFNENYTSCDIEFKILNDSKNYNSTLNLLFRTEKMNEPYLVSQYNPEKDETSYIFGMIYDQKPIPVPEKPDTDINNNYYTKFQSNEKTDTPSLFIFLIDQSGSMAGSSMRLVSESLLFFLQSLPKDSFFQLIGFGSTYKKINEKPLLYNRENVKNTMDIVKTLKANLGGTDISSPLKDIFSSKDYDDIKLGRNLFILTDGEVNNREECLELISMNCEKFKVHAIGIGSSFDKKLIQNAGIQGKGSYHFVNNVSDVNSIIIQSLSKCLRNYLLNAKLSLDKVKPEYEFLPKNSFIYPDEILNYYFIIKGKSNDQNIQINFESSKKSDQYIFSTDKITKENDGDIIGQIIIGNILKNDDKLDENLEIKLSKNYQILSKKTSLFVVGEGNETNKIAEFKQVKKKKKPEYNYYSSNKNSFMNERVYNNSLAMNVDNYDMPRGRGIKKCKDRKKKEYDKDREYGFKKKAKRSLYNERSNYEERAPKEAIKACYKCDKEEDDDDMIGDMFCQDEDEDDDDEDFGREYKKKSKCKRSIKGKECKMSSKKEKEKIEKCEKKEEKKYMKSLEEAKYKKSIKESDEKVEFSNKELVLTQDIFDGYWKINPQTKFLIEKEKTAYENIEKIVKEKNLDKEEIKVTLLVLYYLNTDSSINKIEYSLIIKKGVSFLEKNGINFDEILPMIKN